MLILKQGMDQITEDTRFAQRERWSTTRMNSHTDVSYSLKGQFKTSLQSQISGRLGWLASPHSATASSVKARRMQMMSRIR
ncbi:hypothetical protein AAFF_G00025160 [Aldrovandia affinis]|uniref:Uncharacterized protein n=1 Tax=Aldrovandia affinis TaxID=143900 RepID=A0AAD7T6Q4_9TELE|nr:hypothetical protein AAFF_G00025160 [Aldrovandia affinis]